ncbi:unnamed protein product [Spirodela intermedia]|uniref:Protein DETOXIFICATION n=1 Tax=Spirodela intermedia TaxID=51605 RepID=A0A7I8JTU6_SPIIN|nr:unnamed protein product [Spirodela intermedia]CAA6673524.1 unnamed protein product [Spirodela intermedia]
MRRRGGSEADLGDITTCRTFLKEAVEENKRLWYLAGPAIFTSIAQYSLGAVTQVFAGHLTTLELDAVSTENMVIAGLAFGIMLGMGSALETLCGQAYGAKQLHMMGVYMQRSWLILMTMCLCLMPIYLLPRRSCGFSLFAYGANFPIQKFLQAQSKVMTMAVVSAVGLLLHLLLSWLFIVRLGLGLPGAAASLNISWWAVVLGQLLYILMGNCPGAWTGFSLVAFRDLAAFARLSIASAIMMCLEFWYLMFLVVLAGHLRNAEIAVAAISICVNLSGWEIMVFFGFNAAISVRISNELGARRPRAAKFSILVVVISSAIIGVFFMALVLSLRDVYGVPFTNSPVVSRAVSDLAVLFSFTLLLNSVQPVLTGECCRGAGWQTLVACVNLFCYYVVGLPLGFLLDLTLIWEMILIEIFVKGIWSGMISGVLLQTLILTGITLCTNWNKEAAMADSRIKKWGGSVENHKAMATHGSSTCK